MGPPCDVWILLLRPPGVTVSPMNRGVSLIEMLVVLAMIGLLVAVALPLLSSPMDRLAVERSAQAVALAHQRAKMLALTESRVTHLTVRPDSLTIDVLTDTLVLRRWRTLGPAAEGVLLTGPTRALSFAPTGLAMGVANARFILSRGVASRQVVVSRYGRVRVMP